MAVTHKIVRIADVRRFIRESMEAVGTCFQHADCLSKCLVMADVRGHYSHGLNRLDMYMKDIKDGTCEREGEPFIIKENLVTAHVDGKNVLGPVVGKFCMELAIPKAKQNGIGWVTAKGSNHFGIAGFYSLMASSVGLLGLAFTNTSPIVATTRGKQKFLGTNPISLAAPSTGKPYVLDMATSAVAIGKVEMQERKGKSIPDCWMIDKDGKSIQDPGQMEALLPLGGFEETSGYKGYGLAMMVEIFCAILSGSARAPHVRQWKETNSVANLGQCFIAINPEFFEDGFEERMSRLMKDVRDQTPIEGEEKVLVAGDPEIAHEKLCHEIGGIPYHPNLISYMERIGNLVGVKSPQVLASETQL